VSNRRIVNLDAKVFAVSLDGTASKLGQVVSYDLVWDPKPADDRIDELHCSLLVDFDHRGHFRPFNEFVDGDIPIPVPSNGPRKCPQDVQPPHNEWQ
jgi:hypothetical protein